MVLYRYKWSLSEVIDQLPPHFTRPLISGTLKNDQNYVYLIEISPDLMCDQINLNKFYVLYEIYLFSLTYLVECVFWQALV